MANAGEGGTFFSAFGLSCRVPSASLSNSGWPNCSATLPFFADAFDAIFVFGSIGRGIVLEEIDVLIGVESCESVALWVLCLKRASKHLAFFTQLTLTLILH